MAYDPELDKEIDRRDVEVDGLVYEVSLRSYNGGEPKVSISRKAAGSPSSGSPRKPFSPSPTPCGE
jgi:hypothetical protein